MVNNMQIYTASKPSSQIVISVRGDFWAQIGRNPSVPNPTGFILTSFEFFFTNLRYTLYIPQMIGNFPETLNLNQLLLQLNRFI